MVLRTRLALVRCAALAVLALTVFVSPAGAKEWRGGQTASYTVRVPDGPSYNVAVRVPSGATLDVDDGSMLTVASKGGSCQSAGPAYASLKGKTFQWALHHHNWRLVATGPATGHVRWAEFASGPEGHERYDYFAIDPRLVRRGSSGREYYGFEVGDSECLSRRLARKLMRSARITPAPADPAAHQTWTGGQTASYDVRVQGGPAYRVEFGVPEGITVESASTVAIDGWSAPPEITFRGADGCESSAPGDKSADGFTLIEALRDLPLLADRITDSGPGTGEVRWAEYEGEFAGHPTYDFVALDPRLVRKDIVGNAYYGFTVDAFCMPREVAKGLASSVRLTPLADAAS